MHTYLGISPTEHSGIYIQANIHSIRLFGLASTHSSCSRCDLIVKTQFSWEIWVQIHMYIFQYVLFSGKLVVTVMSSSREEEFWCTLAGCGLGKWLKCHIWMSGASQHKNHKALWYTCFVSFVTLFSFHSLVRRLQCHHGVLYQPSPTGCFSDAMGFNSYQP